MITYSLERKEAVLKKLVPPQSRSVREVSRQEGISDVTLYTWRRQAMGRGDREMRKGKGKLPEQWSAEAKLAVVIATATLTEMELGQYCRKQGIYPEQAKGWRQACLDGQTAAMQRSQSERVQTQADKKRIHELERELHRKEKALAEAAALLMLRKKLQALWGEDGDS